MKDWTRFCSPNYWKASLEGFMKNLPTEPNEKLQRLFIVTVGT